MKNFGLKGHFDIVKKKADGSIVEQYSFDNLILDNGLNLIGTKFEQVINYCHLGSGNAEPNVKQTQLFGFLSAVLYRGGENDGKVFDLESETKSLNITRKFIFAAGVATGNIAEIGMANSQSATDGLFCRTLIKDSQGRPTVISKLADEILEVFYTLKIIINHQDITGVGVIDGEEYTYILRPSMLGNFSVFNGVFSDKEIASITGHPVSVVSYRPVTTKAYVSDSYQLFYTVFASVDDITVPVRSVMFMGVFGIRWQCQFSKKSDGSAIPKDRTKTLSLTFSVSWGRA